MRKVIFSFLILALVYYSPPAWCAMRTSASLGVSGALEANIEKGDSGIPIGTVAVWSQSKLPPDGYWAFCDGSKANPEYVKATGKDYLPDYRGVVLRGYKGTDKGTVTSGKSAISATIDKNVNKSQALGKFSANNLGEHRHVAGKSSNQWGYDSHGYGAWLPYNNPGHSTDPLRKEIGTTLPHHHVWTGWEAYDVTLTGKALPFDEKTKQVLTEAGVEQMPANVTVNYIVKVR